MKTDDNQSAISATDADRLKRRLESEFPDISGDLPFLCLPGHSTLSHNDYKVAYQDDGSALVWARGEGLLAFTCRQVYYSQTNIEHLARCLGVFTKEKRSEMIGCEDKWIDGIHWSADGGWLDIK